MANETTTSTLNDLFTNIIAQARFTAEEQSLMLGLVTQYNIAGQAGKTVQIPKYPAVTAAALDEGTAPADTDVSTSSVTASITSKSVSMAIVSSPLSINVTQYCFEVKFVTTPFPNSGC